MKTPLDAPPAAGLAAAIFVGRIEGGGSPLGGLGDVKKITEEVQLTDTKDRLQPGVCRGMIQRMRFF